MNLSLFYVLSCRDGANTAALGLAKTGAIGEEWSTPWEYVMLGLLEPTNNQTKRKNLVGRDQMSSWRRFHNV